MEELLFGSPPWRGFASAEAEAYAVAVDIELTPELRDEGLARELVHRLQNMRRKAGFQIADRIRTYYEGDADIRRVMERHGDYLRAETLSLELVPSPGPEGAYAESLQVEGHPVTLAVRRVG